ncbi:hypothetical protein F-VV57_0228 [Faustovirus]|nr:hypothetical protein F-VV57_0228 [Faustovirus]QJX73496.1 hypothetical protein F-VV63_0230 [Faustovirus]
MSSYKPLHDILNRNKNYIVIFSPESNCENSNNLDTGLLYIYNLDDKYCNEYNFLVSKKPSDDLNIQISSFIGRFNKWIGLITIGQEVPIIDHGIVKKTVKNCMPYYCALSIIKGQIVSSLGNIRWKCTYGPYDRVYSIEEEILNKCNTSTYWNNSHLDLKLPLFVDYTTSNVFNYISIPTPHIILRELQKIHIKLESSDTDLKDALNVSLYE